ncbi:MAG: cytochrome c3 family protein [Elusimicrobia bacterium]|nr:cytochrome c3 family protein [Elusimicrobiota bacterium]
MALSARALDLDAAASFLWDLLRQRPVQAVLASCAGLIGLTVLTAGWLTQTDRLSRGYAPVQPIPFSHRDHAGAMAMSCLYCHSGAARSRAAGIPGEAVCMGCHSVTKTESPSIKTLKEAFDSATPIPWKAVHSLPGHVFFDHRPHVNAGVACQTCHGPVQEMTVVSQRMSMRMSHCLGCHRDPKSALPQGSAIAKAPENCNACHR